MALARLGAEALLGSFGIIGGVAPDIAVLSDGKFAVTWVEIGNLFDGTAENIYMRVFNADGSPATPAVIVNQTTALTQSAAQVIALDNGGFAIGWVDLSIGNTEVYVRTYDSAGADTSGGEVRLTNDTTVAGGSDDNSAFILTALTGGFAVTYDDREDLDPIDRAFHSAQILSNTGTVTTPEFEQNPAFVFLAGQTALNNGNVVTVYEGPSRNVTLRFTDDTLGGAPAGFSGATGPVDILTASRAQDIERPAAAALSDGGFALAYFLDEDDPATPVRQYIVVSAYDSDGTARGETLIEITGFTFSAASSEFQLLGLSSGGFVIAWVENVSPTAPSVTDRELRMQAFNADGSANGDAVVINTQSTDGNMDQGPMRLSEMADGSIAVVFSDGSDIPDSPTFAGVDLHITFFEIAGGVIGGTAGADVLPGTTGDDSILGEGGDDSIGGLDGNDTIDSGAGNDVVNAGGGNDTLTDSSGMDTLNGGTGNDAITASGAGSNTLRGQAGDDTVTGSVDADYLAGGIGADTIFGGGGADELLGQGNVDTLFGGAGNDVLRGGSGDDSLYGDDDDDTLFGQGNNDVLYGGDGADRLVGAAGADSLFGGAGNDSLFGGTGGDFLTGGTGNDVLNGGAQTDTFLYEQGTGNDEIRAFGATDNLHLDMGLTGTLTVTEVLDQLATDTADGVLFSFSATETLLVRAVTEAEIEDNILIV